MGNLAQSYIADAIRAVAPRFGTIKQNVRDLAGVRRAVAMAEEARVPLFLARVPLSEERWQEIKEASRLPDEARGDIERALAIGKHLWASAKRAPASETKEKLQRLAELATAMCRELAEPDLQSVLLPRAPAAPESEAGIVQAAQLVASGAGMPKRRAFEQLPFSLLLRQLEELRRRCESAVHALPAEKRGAAKSAEISRWLVSELDTILYTHTGHHISRSRKRPGYERRYIELCFAAANPEMGSGSIDKAMQFYIQLRSGTRNE